MKVRDIEVGRRIGESSKFRIYLGKTPSEQSVILKVAKTFEDGDILASEAGEFNILYVFSEQIAEFERKAGLESARYDLLFANLIASFIRGFWQIMISCRRSFCLLVIQEKTILLGQR